MRIGFMQGRLSPPVDGRIQAFPVQHWRREFPLAERCALPLMEWTLDHDALYDNPLMTPAGRAEIAALSARHSVTVPSLTADFFMQLPFFKVSAPARAVALAQLRDVIGACGRAGIGMIVIPLVDQAHMDGASESADVRATLLAFAPLLEMSRVQLAFELDLPPAAARRFIESFPTHAFGINYDIGNSAALGYDVVAEVTAYGEFIRNVHVKDRVRGGGTVPLGTGSADLPRALSVLLDSGYRGNFVLQTARAADGDDVGALLRYRDYVLPLLQQDGIAARPRG